MTKMVTKLTKLTRSFIFHNNPLPRRCHNTLTCGTIHQKSFPHHTNTSKINPEFVTVSSRFRNNQFSTLLNKHLWKIYRNATHRCPQSRCRSVNPYDNDDSDDDDDTFIEYTAFYDDLIIPRTKPSRKLDDKKKRDDNGDGDDDDMDYKDYDDDAGDDKESSEVGNPTRNIKRFEIPEGPIPGPIKYAKTRQETFFQFDYRNVPKHENMQVNLSVLLKKIQMTIQNTELEPYHMRRGCETLRKNIENLPDGAKFRVGGDKKSLRKLGCGYDQAVNVTTHRALRKSMFYLLWERHAILTSGITHDWKKLTSKEIGQSLLGPETRIVCDQQLGKEIIQELWIRGVSSKYNRLIKRHIDRSGENNYLRYLQPHQRLTKKQNAQIDWNDDLKWK